MSKKSGSCLTTQHAKYRVCLYNKTIIPFALVVYEAHGIIVKYAFIVFWSLAANAVEVTVFLECSCKV